MSFFNLSYSQQKSDPVPNIHPHPHRGAAAPSLSFDNNFVMAFNIIYPSIFIENIYSENNGVFVVLKIYSTTIFGALVLHGLALVVKWRNDLLWVFGWYLKKYLRWTRAHRKEWNNERCRHNCLLTTLFPVRSPPPPPPPPPQNVQILRMANVYFIAECLHWFYGRLNCVCTGGSAWMCMRWISVCVRCKFGHLN